MSANPQTKHPAPEAGEDTKRKRNILAQNLDLSISPARCLQHIKKRLNPASAQAQKTVRISNDAPSTMSTIATHITQSLVTHAMEQAVASDQKIVDLSSLFTDSLEKLTIWPIICDNRSIKTYDPVKEQQLKALKTSENKALRQAREVAKKEGKVEEKAKPQEKDEEGDSLSSFITYIDVITKKLKSNPKYASLRVSNRFREVMSEIITQTIHQLTVVTKIYVIELKGVSTLNGDHLYGIVKSQLTKYYIDEPEHAEMQGFQHPREAGPNQGAVQAGGPEEEEGGRRSAAAGGR